MVVGKGALKWTSAVFLKCMSTNHKKYLLASSIKLTEKLYINEQVECVQEGQQN